VPELRGPGRRHFQPELVTRPVCDRDCEQRSIIVGFPPNTFTPEMRPRLYSEYMANYMAESEYMVFTPPLPEVEYQRILVTAGLDGLEDRYAEGVHAGVGGHYLNTWSGHRRGHRFKQEHEHKSQSSHAEKKAAGPQLVAPRLVSASELSVADAEARRRAALVDDSMSAPNGQEVYSTDGMAGLEADVALAELRSVKKASKAQDQHEHEGEIEVLTPTSGKTVFQSKPIPQPRIADDNAADEWPSDAAEAQEDTPRAAFSRGRQVDTVLGVEDEN